MTHTSRTVAAAGLSLLAIIAILATVLAQYTHQVLVNPAGFANRAVSVVRNQDVELLVVERVTSQVAQATGDAAAIQPLAEDAVTRLLSNGEVIGQIRATALSLQRQLVSSGANSLVLTLPDLGSSLAASAGAVNPEVTDELRRIGSLTVVDVAIPSADAQVIHDIAAFGQEASLLLWVTVALVLLALSISPRRAHTLRTLGVGALLSGLIAAAIALGGRELVSEEFSSQNGRAVADAAWTLYVGGLETWGFVLAGVGAGVTAIGMAGRRRARLR